MSSKHKNKSKKTPSISTVVALLALVVAFRIIPAWGWILVMLGCLLFGGWKRKSKR